MYKQECSTRSPNKWEDIDLLKDVLKHADPLPSTISWLPAPQPASNATEVNPPSNDQRFVSSVSSPSSSDQSNEQITVYQQISAVYSGPTVLDIEKALSVTTDSSLRQQSSRFAFGLPTPLCRMWFLFLIWLVYCLLLLHG